MNQIYPKCGQHMSGPTYTGGAAYFTVSDTYEQREGLRYTCRCGYSKTIPTLDSVGKEQL